MEYCLREERIRIKLLMDLKRLQKKHNVTFYQLEYIMDKLEVYEILEKEDFKLKSIL